MGHRELEGIWGVEGLTREDEQFYEDLVKAGPGGTPLTDQNDASARRLARVGLARIEALSSSPPQVFASSARPVFESRIRERERRLAILRDVADSLNSRYEALHDVDRAITEVHGVAATGELLKLAHTSARSLIRAFDRGPYISDPPSVAPEQSENAARGVVYRVVYDQSIDHGHVDLIRSSQELGEQARVIRGLPMRMIITDDSQALLIFTRRGESGAAVSIDGIHVGPSALLEAMISLFEGTWDVALPVSVGDQERPDREHRVLRLLAAGASDAAIARSLKVSERTVQRHVAALLKRYGVESRFQLGVQAGRLGLLD